MYTLQILILKLIRNYNKANYENDIVSNYFSYDLSFFLFCIKAFMSVVIQKHCDEQQGFTRTKLTLKITLQRKLNSTSIHILCKFSYYLTVIIITTE